VRLAPDSQQLLRIGAFGGTRVPAATTSLPDVSFLDGRPKQLLIGGSTAVGQAIVRAAAGSSLDPTTQIGPLVAKRSSIRPSLSAVWIRTS
jgi:hypothetical protein